MTTYIHHIFKGAFSLSFEVLHIAENTIRHHRQLYASFYFRYWSDLNIIFIRSCWLC